MSSLRHFTWCIIPLVLAACQSARIATHETPTLGPADGATISQSEPDTVAAGSQSTSSGDAPGSTSKAAPTRTLQASEQIQLTAAEESDEALFDALAGTSQVSALFPPAPMPLEPVADAGANLHGLTLFDLQQIALRNNPTLPLAHAEVEKERGLWQQVGLYPNPTVGYVNSSTSSNGQSQQNGMLVQQTFITAGKLDKARARESYGIRNTQWQQESQRLRVMNDVRLRYYDVLAAQEQIRMAESLQKLSSQALTAAQELWEAQQVPKTDLLHAEVQHRKIQTALENAQIEYQTAWHKLAVIIGCPLMQPQPLEEPAEVLPTFELEQEWQRLVAQSPQLKSVQAQVGIAHMQWLSAEVAPIPDITLQFVSQYDSIGDYSTFNSLVAIPLPVFNRNQGGKYNASQEYVRAQKEVERVCLVLRDQLVTSYGNYLAAKNQAQQLREEVLPRLKETLELTVKGYRVQEYGILEVLNVQEQALQSNLTYLKSLTEARRLAVEIEGLQLTGGLNPASIGTAIQEVGTGGRLRAVQAQLNKQNNAGLSNFAPAALD